MYKALLYIISTLFVLVHSDQSQARCSVKMLKGIFSINSYLHDYPVEPTKVTTDWILDGQGGGSKNIVKMRCGGYDCVGHGSQSFPLTYNIGENCIGEISINGMEKITFSLAKDNKSIWRITNKKGYNQYSIMGHFYHLPGSSPVSPIIAPPAPLQ